MTKNENFPPEWHFS